MSALLLCGTPAIEMYSAQYMGLSAMQVQTKVMNNYMGIGVDAKVSLEFDRLRTKFPHWFKSQMGGSSWLKLMHNVHDTSTGLHIVLSSAVVHTLAIL